MKKVLILTDSLALPREKPEYCGHENTWPQLLNKHCQLHQVSLGGGTVQDLVRQLEYHKLFNPDIIIIQSGIVDCAPRALSLLELKLLQKIPFFGKRILKLVQKNSYYLRKKRKVYYTKAILYQNSLNKIKSFFPEEDVYALSILPSNVNYELKVPGITKQISLYNEILKLKFKGNLINVQSIPSEGIMSDYIHLNALGHSFVYESIMKAIF
ncbi:hypothetical protein GCM10027429_28690 [Marivirga atlantica]|uniref:SGNH/GDSL hydrolase family protein n=1 Tax=Marivirga atlantica TaxID=1548457 RepID=A0A937AJ42_9BACT|nr:hypothetical protein [Marivirga atlantica]MBL0766449.1 hypothetical protein [Marivirga atlantica]